MTYSSSEIRLHWHRNWSICGGFPSQTFLINYLSGRGIKIFNNANTKNPQLDMMTEPVPSIPSLSWSLKSFIPFLPHPR
jgi:hypothetical protein